MFDFVRNHRKLFFFVLVLLIIPSFVFFGVQGYNRADAAGNATVAKVAGHEITQLEWDAAHRQQADQIRRSVPGIDAKLLDSPEVKREALERLVRERVLFTAANKQHLIVTDEQLQREILAIPQLAQFKLADGGIDVGAYKTFLQAQGLTPQMFEQSLRQEAVLRQAVEPQSTVVPNLVTAARTSLEAMLQRRDVQILRLETKNYTSKVDPSAADLESYYKANEATFRAPEQASIEYVVLDAAALQSTITVPADDLRKYYEENRARFTKAEERQASHILIKADKAAPADQRAAAKAQAEKILAEVRKSPDQFAALARKHSQDPGSAAQGGDLGFFGRSAMVKPFEDAAYAMKPGEISNVVETDFGYHIIRLAGTRGGEAEPFDAVKPRIEGELKQQLAQQEFAKVADQFGNLAYEQADTLQPIVERMKLSKRTAKVARTPSPDATGGPLASDKLLEAIFSDDTLKNKRNTAAIETGTSQLTVARVTAYEPARLRPLDEVKDAVREAVVAQQAAALARKEGEAQLAALKAGQGGASLPPAMPLSRAQTQGQPPNVVDAVMRAPSKPLPQWVGVDLGASGYAIVRVNAVTVPPADSPEVAALAPRYQQAWAAAQGQAYYDALKKRYKAEILVKGEATAAGSNKP